MLRHISRSVFAAATAAAVIAAPAVLAPSAYAASQSEKPVGHITFEAHSVDAGVGWTWDEGKLVFGKKTYRFKIHGGDVAAVGFSGLEAHGDVYNLTKPDDFNGTYATLTGEATVAVGASGTILQNSHDVRIRLKSDTAGVRLAAGVQGLSFELVDDK